MAEERCLVVDGRPSSQKSVPPCVCCVEAVNMLAVHVFRVASSPSQRCVALVCCWVNSWVEMEDAYRKIKLKLCLIEAPNCYELLLCSLHGAWVSRHYCFCCCADVSFYIRQCKPLLPIVAGAGWAERLVPSWE